MNCDICYELFDHSIRKPYSLATCPHTYCSKCLQQFNSNNCPQCNEPIKGKNINLALLKLIPESSYDRLKEKSLKTCVEINEMKKDLKKNREEKLNIHETKLNSIKQTISDETNKIITILKQNELMLTNECDTLLDEIKFNLNSNNYEENIMFQIDNSKMLIEKDELDEDELNILKNQIIELKDQLNHCSDQLKNFEISFKFIENQISNCTLLFGKIIKVILKLFNIILFIHSIFKKKKDDKSSKSESIAYYTKANSLRNSNKLEEAIECYDKAIQIDPNYALAYNKKGFLLILLNKTMRYHCS